MLSCAAADNLQGATRSDGATAAAAAQGVPHSRASRWRAAAAAAAVAAAAAARGRCRHILDDGHARPAVLVVPGCSGLQGPRRDIPAGALLLFPAGIRMVWLLCRICSGMEEGPHCCQYVMRMLTTRSHQNTRTTRRRWQGSRCLSWRAWTWWRQTSHASTSHASSQPSSACDAELHPKSTPPPAGLAIVSSWPVR